MELLKLSLLAFVIYVQIHTGVSSFSEDADIWSLENWQDDPAASALSLRFDDLLKRSKSQSQQFHGLMGRSLEIAPPLQLGRKRTNGETFVGLMGKRSSKRDFDEFPDELQ